MIFLLCSLVLVADARAQTLEGDDPGAEVSALQVQSQEQGELLEQQINEVSGVGAELKEAQAEVGAAASRAEDLASQSQKLGADLSTQRRAHKEARARYEKQARAAYRGEDVDALVYMLGGIVGTQKEAGDFRDLRDAEALLQSAEDLKSYKNSQRVVQNTVRQVEHKRAEYKVALDQQQAKAAELRRREERLEISISRIRDRQAQTDNRIQQLRREERNRILETSPATGVTTVQKSEELKIARHEIVVRKVEPISKKRYMKLYKKSAKKYGFKKDWHILAAVGKVESDHGKNMGPSSAGAMGPMQFLPSTWKTSGVDGNGDGVANVMDPEDAIPAAAKYLKTGGAPKDWYAALFSYNHADWYVKKVLGVAEGYRRLAEDNRVGPYV